MSLGAASLVIVPVHVPPTVQHYLLNIFELAHDPLSSGVDVWLAEQVWQALPSRSLRRSVGQLVQVPMHGPMLNEIFAELTHQMTFPHVLPTHEFYVEHWIGGVIIRLEQATGQSAGSQRDWHVDRALLEIGYASSTGGDTLLEIAVDTLKELEPHDWWRRVVQPSDLMNADLWRALQHAGYGR